MTRRAIFKIQRIGWLLVPWVTIYAFIDLTFGYVNNEGSRTMIETQDEKINIVQMFYAEREKKLDERSVRMQNEIELLRTMVGQMRP